MPFKDLLPRITRPSKKKKGSPVLLFVNKTGVTPFYLALYKDKGRAGPACKTKRTARSRRSACLNFCLKDSVFSVQKVRALKLSGILQCIHPGMGHLAEVLHRRVNFPGLKIGVGRAPHTKIYYWTDPAFFQKLLPV